MTGKRVQYIGDFDAKRSETFKGTVFVKKANIPEGILSVIGRATVPPDGEWHEVSPWGSCKLVARKRGAVTQYGLRHYGNYTCCKKMAVELAGLPGYGIGISSMPIWARENLAATLRVAYALKHAVKVRVISWTRISMRTMTVVVENRHGVRYQFNLGREDFLRPSNAPWLRMGAGPFVDFGFDAGDDGEGNVLEFAAA